MTDALKMADMQRANVEFERQRHLANWLIQSSPHMPVATAQQQQKQQQLGKKGKFKQNPIFFLAKIGHNMNLTNGPNPAGAGAAMAMGTNSIASTFNSQTNLPLAIVSSSGRDGHKPKLRRFNSHDTSANMFSVADFENARFARRNEIETAAILRQRQQRYKLNSLSSGGDCSTGESKGSKLSNESAGEPLIAEQFLDKFSLPRVVRLSYVSDATGSSSGDQTMTSSSSAESTSTSERKQQKQKKKSSTSASPTTGELFLLYRFMRNYKVFHAFNSKSGNSRKKGYKIPQDYSGYFSFLSDKGTQTATAYTTIVQLVRERVYKFLSLENLSGYTESHDNFNHKTHYVKATAKAGQVYRLLAVFQDGDQKASSSQKDSNSLSGGAEKERGKYAQLLGDNRQIYYVSLSAKGKFYEIEQHTAPVLQKSSSLGHPNSASKAPKQLNRECVHRIGYIMQSDVNLPMNLKLIASMTGAAQNNVPEYITIAKISTENFVVACPLDEQEYASTLTLAKLHITPQMKFSKCSLGFDGEQRMFLNASIQTVLKFCQINCENFTRVVDNNTNWAELQQIMTAMQQQQLQKEQQQATSNSMNHLSGPASMGFGSITPKSDVLKKLKLTRLFGHGDRNQTSSSGHEKEDSIIFFSKNDLESLECGQQLSQQPESLSHQEPHDLQPLSLASGVSDKMRVFTPNKKKWFKGLRSGDNKDHSTDSEDAEKAKSIDRYKDMSRLIQERFGEIDIEGLNSTRANSDIGYDDITSANTVASEGESGLQKCVSLQHIEIQNRANMDIKNKDKPDLVNNIRLGDQGQSEEILSESEDTIFFPIRSSAHQQSFMTQKLYSEFHVKTKQHSKSQSSIQHLLNLANPQRLSEVKSKSKLDKKRSEIVLSFEDLQSLHRDEELEEGINRTQLNILDDLPYSSVRDSLIAQESEPRTPSESIYAEICADSPSTASPRQQKEPIFPPPVQTSTIAGTTNHTGAHQQSPPPRPEKRFTTIRINVPSSDSCSQQASVSHNPAGSRCATTVGSPVEDNIYNTIK
ncbi:uncharacterized protein LOC129749140 [Uranotaenia lowii]|uniref:uncharacterized protein LOC129749140 n=1 Tax=Uranotaenia lowii TaxID=190385 RepID=UPI00247A0A30|nr:uncharacterized protein LOC129749140 [Uranotaenia lowii]